MTFGILLRGADLFLIVGNRFLSPFSMSCFDGYRLSQNVTRLGGNNAAPTLAHELPLVPVSFPVRSP